MLARSMQILAALTLLVFILAAQLGAFQTAEPRVIPLNTAYATFSQEGIKPLDNSVEIAGLIQVLGVEQEPAQRIVLCVGKDIAAAVRASELSFFLADEPAPIVGGAANDILWLAAYLGSEGSLPPAYQLRTIVMNGRNVRIAYERDESPERTSDRRAYLVWVPLGQLEPGAYNLELFDAAAGIVIQAMKWQVTVD